MNSRVPDPHRREWRHFTISVVSMGALGVFTVWRNLMTVGPVRNRFYLFPNDTWLGEIDKHWLGGALATIDHSWLNDFLLGPGTVACFYMAFTVLYAVGGLLFSDDAQSLFNTQNPTRDDSRWSDHRRLMKLILYAILCRMLYSGWAEEVQLIESTFIFDVTDMVVEGVGALTGVWMIRTLSYPLFSRARRFPIDGSDIPNPRKLAPKVAIDAGAVTAAIAYTWIVDPFGMEPLTLHEQWSLPLEFSVIFLVVRWVLLRVFREPRQYAGLNLGK